MFASISNFQFFTIVEERNFKKAASRRLNDIFLSIYFERRGGNLRNVCRKILMRKINFKIVIHFEYAYQYRIYKKFIGKKEISTVDGYLINRQLFLTCVFAHFLKKMAL